jgi:hypothetical protein
MLNLGGGARGWRREEVLDQSCCITTIASFVFTVGEGWYTAAAWERDSLTRLFRYRYFRIPGPLKVKGRAISSFVQNFREDILNLGRSSVSMHLW